MVSLHISKTLRQCNLYWLVTVWLHSYRHKEINFTCVSLWCLTGGIATLLKKTESERGWEIPWSFQLIVAEPRSEQRALESVGNGQRTSPIRPEESH